MMLSTVLMKRVLPSEIMSSSVFYKNPVSAYLHLWAPKTPWKMWH